MIAEDEDMRTILRIENAFRETMGFMRDPETFEVPDGFSESVMQSVTDLDSGKQEEMKTKTPARKFFEQVVTPREIRMRPVYGIAAALIVALLFAVPYTLEQESGLTAEGEQSEYLDEVGNSTQLVSDREKEVWIRFVYFDENAKSIAVAGDFTDWDPVQLNREIINGNQVWTGLMPVTRGEQRYMFVKDGEEWVTDPLAEIQRDDGFGNKNAVLIL